MSALQKTKTVPTAYPKPIWFNTTFTQIDENGNDTKLGDKLVFNTLNEKDIDEQDYVSFFTIVQESEDFCSHECLGIASYYYAFNGLLHESRTVLPRARKGVYTKKIGLVNISLSFETDENGTIATLSHQWSKRSTRVRRFRQNGVAKRL